MMLSEIGLECEYWLLDFNDNIIEAPKYNFPADEMGFLIEVRSAWGSDPDHIVGTLETELLAQRVKAEALGFHIECSPFKEVEKKWQDYIARKYRHNEMEDFTQNIYGKSHVSHHTGFMLDRATAGCHVHFSRWYTGGEGYIPFTEAEIRIIVGEMDEKFGELIGDTRRLLGEWEPKPAHGGFEYRSLPCTVPLFDVTETALEILRNI